MSGKIVHYRNMLSEDLIEKIRSFSYTQQKHRLNLTSWCKDAIGWSGSIILFDVENEIKDEVLKQLNPMLEMPDGEYEYEVVYTLGSRLSFIPWHDDGDYERACTVYLNDAWDLNWAGAFIYEKENEFHAVYPEHNKGLVVFPPVKHTTTMPAINAPLRESLQVFVKKPDGGLK